MTDEPSHTASKEMRVPELVFSSERVSQLPTTDSKVKWPLHFAFSYIQPYPACYTALQMQMKNNRSASAINSVTTKIQTICVQLLT